MYLRQLLFSAALMGAAYAFGAAVQLGERLHRRGYVWFRGAPLVVGGVAAGLGAAMLALGDPILHLMWLAVLVGWLVRGRIDGVPPAMIAAAMLAMIVLGGPRIEHYYGVTAYFFAVLIPSGVAFDRLRARQRTASRGVQWLLAREHLVWYAMAAGYCLLFELDAVLCLAVHGFVTGYQALNDEGARARLRSWGIRRDAAAGSA